MRCCTLCVCAINEHAFSPFFEPHRAVSWSWFCLLTFSSFVLYFLMRCLRSPACWDHLNELQFNNWWNSEVKQNVLPIRIVFTDTGLVISWSLNVSCPWMSRNVKCFSDETCQVCAQCCITCWRMCSHAAFVLFITLLYFGFTDIL